MQSVSKTDIQQDIAETPSKKILLNAIKSGKIKIYTIKSSKHWDKYVLTLSFNGQFAVLHPVITAQNAYEVLPQLTPTLFNDKAPIYGRLVSASRINKKPIWAHRLRHAIKAIENDCQGIIPTIKQQFKAGSTEFKRLTEWIRYDYGKQLGFLNSLNRSCYAPVINLWCDLDYILPKSQSEIVVNAMTVAVKKFSPVDAVHLDSALDGFYISLQKVGCWNSEFKHNFYNTFCDCSTKYCNQTIDGFSFDLIDFYVALQELFKENTGFAEWCNSFFGNFLDANRVSCALTTVKNSYKHHENIKFTTANETAKHTLDFYSSPALPSHRPAPLPPVGSGSGQTAGWQTGYEWVPDPELAAQLPDGFACAKLVKSFEEAVPQMEYPAVQRGEFRKFLLKSFCDHFNIYNDGLCEHYLYELAESSPDVKVSARIVNEAVKIIGEYLTTDGKDPDGYAEQVADIYGIKRFCMRTAKSFLRDCYKNKLQTDDS